MPGLESTCLVPEMMVQTARALLGRNIARLVERPGFSMSGLAAHCAVPTSMASRWKRGGTLPTKYIDRIAEYFGVPVAELFSVDEKRQADARLEKPNLDQAFRLLADHLGYNVRRARASVKKT